MGCNTLYWLCRAKASISGRKGRRGSGCWRFLTSLLTDSLVQEKVLRWWKETPTIVVFHLVTNAAVNVLINRSRSRWLDNSEEFFGFTQYCLGLYPWYEPVSFILATYIFFSSSLTLAKGISAMSNIRFVFNKDKQLLRRRQNKSTGLCRREPVINNIEKAVVRHRLACLMCKSQAIFWGGSLR